MPEHRSQRSQSQRGSTWSNIETLNDLKFTIVLLSPQEDLVELSFIPDPCGRGRLGISTNCFDQIAWVGRGWAAQSPNPCNYINCIGLQFGRTSPGRIILFVLRICPLPCLVWIRFNSRNSDKLSDVRWQKPRLGP